MAIYTEYATEADVAEYLGITEPELPEDITRLIKRASEMIKQITLNNIVSTNADHLEAAKLATCAQIEYWDIAGENASMIRGIGNFKIGNFSVGYKGGDSGSSSDQSVAPRAKMYLADQGLLYRGGVRLNDKSIGLYDSDLSN